MDQGIINAIIFAILLIIVLFVLFVYFKPRLSDSEQDLSDVVDDQEALRNELAIISTEQETMNIKLDGLRTDVDNNNSFTNSSLNAHRDRLNKNEYDIKQLINIQNDQLRNLGIYFTLDSLITPITVETYAALKPNQILIRYVTNSTIAEASENVLATHDNWTSYMLTRSYYIVYILTPVDVTFTDIGATDFSTINTTNIRMDTLIGSVYFLHLNTDTALGPTNRLTETGIHIINRPNVGSIAENVIPNYLNTTANAFELKSTNAQTERFIVTKTIDTTHMFLVLDI